MVTQAKVNMLKILKKASKENDAPIWAKVADYVQKSRSNQKIINLTRINQTTEDGNAIVITGKILGTGNISHKVSVSVNVAIFAEFHRACSVPLPNLAYASNFID